MLESFSCLAMENSGKSYYLPAPQLSGKPHNLPNRSSSPSFKLFSPLNIHKQSGSSIINIEEHDENALNSDCKGSDNALACLDDFLMGEDVAECNEINMVVPQDPFTIFSFPYNINYFANAPASSFRLDQFNALVDETSALLNMGPTEHHKTVPGSEPDCFSNVDELLLNATQNIGCLPACGDEFVPHVAESALADWHASRELGSTWPLVVYQKPGQCEQCEILRQIIHTNGLQGTKLEIHGREGQNYHAVMQTRFWLNDGCPPTVEHQMVEFPVGNSDYVKQFLLQYSLLRKKEGFLLQQDSVTPSANTGYRMSSAAHTLPALGFNCCVKEEDPSCMKERPSIVAKHEYIIEADDAAKYGTLVSQAKPVRGSAAAQRERTGKLKMSDLAKHFHLPINAAAKELGICPTVLKKICRRNGMRRWPHRKIKSIERIIATLEQTIAEGAGQGDEDIRKEIAMLRNERIQLCAGLMGQT